MIFNTHPNDIYQVLGFRVSIYLPLILILINVMNRAICLRSLSDVAQNKEC